MKHATWTVLALACAAGLGATAVAENGGNARLSVDEEKALQAAGETGAFAQAVQAQNKRLRIERSHYPRLFRAAYARYPAIPRGTLEALAYAQSRWHTLRPDRTGELDHPHMPQAWGVMGLYNGDGFADQVGEAAALLGASPQQVRENPLTNVLGAAALLNQALRGTGARAGDPASLAQGLQRYAGFRSDGSDIGDFARATFAKEVLQALDFGVNEHGIVVPEQAVEWERAFPAGMLTKLRAPMVRLDEASGRAEIALESEHFKIDAITGEVVAKATDVGTLAVDFPGATWDASPNYNSRSGTAVREVIQHTTEGSFAGAISWFNNPDSNVSAHYVLSGTGQVVQMVREADRAWHAGDHNSHSIGIEHAGYANDPGTWTSAILNVSSAITRQACARYAGVACTNAVRGNPSPTADVAESIAIKGHGMVSGADRYDPGQYFGWERYYNLINPGSGGTTTILDSFESSVGHFTTSPTYSGSTTGIATASTSGRNCTIRYAGSCSLNVKLVDNPGSDSSWAVRLLSGAGNPGSNTALARSGRVGFYVYSGGSGMSVGVGIDDSDGTERSTSRAIPANTWTWVEWNLSDAALWNAWAGGSDGAITASSVKLDAIWFYRAQTSYDVQLYVDNVQLRN